MTNDEFKILSLMRRRDMSKAQLAAWQAEDAKRNAECAWWVEMIWDAMPLVRRNRINLLAERAIAAGRAKADQYRKEEDQ